MVSRVKTVRFVEEQKLETEADDHNSLDDEQSYHSNEEENPSNANGGQREGTGEGVMRTVSMFMQDQEDEGLTEEQKRENEKRY